MTEQTLKKCYKGKQYEVLNIMLTTHFKEESQRLEELKFFEKAVKFQEKFNKHGIAVNNSIQTNGYNINEDWCKFLKK